MIELILGDITEQETDAIVNPANSQLQLGGGVAGAIHKKGGPTIQEECNKIGKCRVGEAVITTGGQLKSKHVIHAVGPRWGEGNEDNKLHSAVTSALQIADQNGLKSVALPAISTGIFGFPTDRAAEVILDAIGEHLERSSIKKVVICLWDKESYGVFKVILKEMMADFN